MKQEQILQFNLSTKKTRFWPQQSAALPLYFNSRFSKFVGLLGGG
jgi:hypothetical protein